MLYVKSINIKTWKKRLFSVEKNAIRCFREETSKKIHFEIPINNETQIFDVNGEAGGRKYMFYVCQPSPTSPTSQDNLLESNLLDLTYFSASSEKEKIQWINAILNCAHDGYKPIHQPDLWSQIFFPCAQLKVHYANSNAVVEHGNLLKPNEVEFTPNISYEALNIGNMSNAIRFSLVLIDFDSTFHTEKPNQNQRERRNTDTSIYVHWAVVDMESSTVSSGHEFAEYISPAPVYNSGLHRFFFLLFHRSLKGLNDETIQEQLEKSQEMFENREEFSLSAWADVMKFQSPTAINGFYAGWESYCDILHSRMGYLPSLDQYKSPYQGSVIVQREKQERIHQEKLNLFQDLSLKDILPTNELFFAPQIRGGISSISLRVWYEHVEVDVIKSIFEVNNGNTLSPKCTQRAPFISFETSLDSATSSDELYTLIFTDPDVPSRTVHTMREYVHWVILNIPGCNINEGSLVLPYLGPMPPYGSDLHRYVFCLYKQSTKFNKPEIKAAQAFFSPRQGLKSFEWIKSVNHRISITSPVGLAAFQSEWIPEVDEYQKLMNIMPPVKYRSPEQLKQLELDSKVEEAPLNDISNSVSSNSQESFGSKSLTVTNNQKSSTKKVVERIPSGGSVSHPGSHVPFKIPSSNTLSSTDSKSNMSVSSKNQSDNTTRTPESARTNPNLSNSGARAVHILPTVASMSYDSTASFPFHGNNMWSSSVPLAEGVTPFHSPTLAQQALARKESTLLDIGNDDVVISSGYDSIDDMVIQLSGRPETIPETEPTVPGPYSPQITNHLINPSTTLGSPDNHAFGSGSDISKSSTLPMNRGVVVNQLPFADMHQDDTMSIISTLTSTSQHSIRSEEHIPKPSSFHETLPHQNHTTVPMHAMQDLSVTLPIESTAMLKSEPEKKPERGLERGPEKDLFVQKEVESKHTDNALFIRTLPLLPEVDEKPSPMTKTIDTPMKSETSQIINIPISLFDQIGKVSNGNEGSNEYCKIFNVTTRSIFDGEKMKKKHSADFLAKESVLWVSPKTSSLHWAKSTADMSDPSKQKHIVLSKIAVDLANVGDGRSSLPNQRSSLFGNNKRDSQKSNSLKIPASPIRDGSNRFDQASGECKGFAINAEVKGISIIIGIDSGDQLELKLNADTAVGNRIANWITVIKSLLDSE